MMIYDSVLNLRDLSTEMIWNMPWTGNPGIELPLIELPDFGSPVTIEFLVIECMRLIRMYVCMYVCMIYTLTL